MNLFLGNLLRQVALKRIDRRDAVTLAYISQLLLNSFPVLDCHVAAEREAEKEAESTRGYNQWLPQYIAASKKPPAKEATNPPNATARPTGT